MLPKFDKLYESLINEVATARAKRRESRYWNTGNAGLSTTVRGPRAPTSHKTDSQQTKLGRQQYVGNGVSRIRGRNTSKKSADEIGVANGVGGHIKIKGVNPKEIGATVNSKQGNMEIKTALPNGNYKVGRSMKTEFQTTDKPYTNIITRNK